MINLDSIHLEPRSCIKKTLFSSSNSLLSGDIFTYNGPGSTLAARTSEYGIIMIGLVGKAKNGCDDPTVSGVFGLSSEFLW